MTIDVERMAQAAHDGFTVAADVADVVAVEAGIDYRTAHTIVGRAVRALAEQGRPPVELTAELLREVAQEVVGASVTIGDGAIASALDPAGVRTGAHAGRRHDAGRDRRDDRRRAVVRRRGAPVVERRPPPHSPRDGPSADSCARSGRRPRDPLAVS